MKKISAIIIIILISIIGVRAESHKITFEEVNHKLVYYSDLYNDKFMSHLDMIPGNTYTDSLMIENDTSTNYTIFLKIETIDQSVDAEELLDNIMMKLYLDDKIIYNGKAKGLDYRNEGINLQDAIMLKTLNKNEKSLLRADIELLPEYSNKENREISYINWVFYAQYDKDNPIKIDGVPKTDSNNYVLIIIGVIVFLAGIIVLVFTNKRKKLKND